VDEVKVGSEVAAINSVIRPSMNMELEGIVRHRFAGDGHARHGASRYFSVVSSDNNVIIDRENKVVERATSRLRDKSDEERSEEQDWKCITRQGDSYRKDVVA
jgi:hypothetical protein